MPRYRHLVPNIYAERSVEGVPHGLPTGVSFRTGAPLAAAVDGPLVYHAPYTSPDQLQHFESELVPLMSERLVEALRGAGATNLQLVPAQVRNPSTGACWTHFHAVNILGLIACASPQAEGAPIATGPDGVPLTVFGRLVIDPRRAGDAALFRLAEAPGTILVAEAVIDHLRAHAPPGGWNLTAYPVDVADADGA